eukprot:9467076-Pyramimonas_sp.AAC.1
MVQLRHVRAPVRNQPRASRRKCFADKLDNQKGQCPHRQPLHTPTLFLSGMGDYLSGGTTCSSPASPRWQRPVTLIKEVPPQPFGSTGPGRNCLALPLNTHLATRPPGDPSRQ